MNVELLRKELDYIQDSELKGVVTEILSRIPECMEHKPSSSSGKYHPAFDNIDGGNINHTKAVVAVAKTLISGILDWERCQYYIIDDYIYAACILHDMCKYGNDPVNTQHTVTSHPMLAANLIRDKYPIIAMLIESHMGKWNQIKNDKQVIGYLPLPCTFMQKLVHMADHIAAQKWISEDILK